MKPWQNDSPMCMSLNTYLVKFKYDYIQNYDTLQRKSKAPNTSVIYKLNTGHSVS